MLLSNVGYQFSWLFFDFPLPPQNKNLMTWNNIKSEFQINNWKICVFFLCLFLISTPFVNDEEGKLEVMRVECDK